jgi:hypothetical protein
MALQTQSLVVRTTVMLVETKFLYGKKVLQLLARLWPYVVAMAAKQFSEYFDK